MGLRDFLHRCPDCLGPVAEAGGDAIRCTRCGTVVGRGKGRGGGLRLFRSGAAAPQPLDPAHARIRVDEGDSGSASLWAVSGRSARVRIARLECEVPVRANGRILGFREQFGPERPGRALELETVLELREPEADGRSGLDVRIPWEDIGALQASSSTLQIAFGSSLVRLRFPEDPVRFWEELARHRIRAAWQRTGRGTVVEFQPRVRAR